MPIEEIASEAEFEQVRQRGDVVIIDAYTTWCGPCKLLALLLDEVVQKFDAMGKPVHVGRFDAEKVPKLAKRLGVTCYPTFFFYYQGDIVEFPTKDGTAKRKFEGAGDNTGRLIEYVVNGLYDGKASERVPAEKDSKPKAPA